uniref:Uncharacterized protein n=1 Tax=Knipowitschia caucasica TaxID=637954 RepID=A0AAV2JTR6_KNICA
MRERGRAHQSVTWARHRALLIGSPLELWVAPNSPARVSPQRALIGLPPRARGPTSLSCPPHQSQSGFPRALGCPALTGAHRGSLVSPARTDSKTLLSLAPPMTTPQRGPSAAAAEGGPRRDLGDQRDKLRTRGEMVENQPARSGRPRPLADVVGPSISEERLSRALVVPPRNALGVPSHGSEGRGNTPRERGGGPRPARDPTREERQDPTPRGENDRQGDPRGDQIQCGSLT